MRSLRTLTGRQMRTIRPRIRPRDFSDRISNTSRSASACAFRILPARGTRRSNSGMSAAGRVDRLRSETWFSASKAAISFEADDMPMSSCSQAQARDFVLWQ